MSHTDPWDRGAPSEEEIEKFAEGLAANILPNYSPEAVIQTLSVLSPEAQKGYLASVTRPGSWEIDFHPSIARAIARVPGATEVFQAQMALAYLGAPPTTFEERREALRAMLPPGFQPAGALKDVDRHLQLCAGIAHAHLGILEDLGFGFDFQNNVVTIPSGGRPRTLVRSLVEEFRKEIREERGRRTPSAEIREAIAPILGPIFGEEWGSTDSRGQLARTLDNV